MATTQVDRREVTAELDAAGYAAAWDGVDGALEVFLDAVRSHSLSAAALEMVVEDSLAVLADLGLLDGGSFEELYSYGDTEAAETALDLLAFVALYARDADDLLLRLLAAAMDAELVYVMQSLVANTELPVPVQEAFLQDARIELYAGECRSLAKNPCLASHLRTELLEMGDSGVVAAVAQHQALTSSEATELSFHPSELVVVSLGRNARTAPTAQWSVASLRERHQDYLVSFLGNPAKWEGLAENWRGDAASLQEALQLVGER